LGLKMKNPAPSHRKASPAGLRLGAALLVLLVLIDLVAIAGIVAARRTARSEAMADLRRQAELDARSFEALLAKHYGDLSFLAKTPSLRRFLALSAGPGDPTARRWATLDAEGALVLAAQASPALLRLALFDAGGASRLVVGRRDGVPLALPPSSPAPAGFALAEVDLAGGGRLAAWLDPQALLAAVGLGDRLLPFEAGAVPSAEESDDGELLRVAVPLRDGLFPGVPPLLLERSAPAGGAFSGLEQLARQYRIALFLNLAIVALTIALGLLALRQVRRMSELEAAQALEARRRELERQLLHTERLSSVGRLAAGLAHEINNPLAGMSHQLELIELDLADGEHAEVARRLGILREGLSRAVGVVRRVLTFADPGRRSGGEVDLRILCAETVEFLRSAPAGREAEIRWSCDVGFPLGGDPVTLGQLLLNLLQNACQMAAAAGPIELEVKAESDGETVLLRVADRGPGLDPEAERHIFEPFYSQRGSTGLGLAVCRGIAEAHGGTIVGQNRADGPGAEFLVRLPRNPPAVLAKESP
jgi:signal transduction histidine kinase